MEMETFCSSMRNEMTAWKTRTHDLIRMTEDMAPNPDQKAKAAINDMKAMIGRIEQTLDRLEAQCPADWGSEKMEIEQAICGIQERWNESASLSPDDFE